MSKKKKKRAKSLTITVDVYLKAIRKASREAELENQPGWKRTTNVHQNKKTYGRRKNKDISED